MNASAGSVELKMKAAHGVLPRLQMNAPSLGAIWWDPIPGCGLCRSLVLDSLWIWPEPPSLSERSDLLS